MIGHLAWAVSPLVALAVAVWSQRKREASAVPPSAYDRHREKYIQTGDLAELELALRQLRGGH